MNNEVKETVTGEIKVELTQAQILTAIKQGIQDAFRAVSFNCKKSTKAMAIFKKVAQAYLDKFEKQNPEFPKYKIKATKLPRKLKKAYKKAGKFNFDFTELVKTAEIRIEV